MPWWGIALIAFLGFWSVAGTVWLIWFMVQFARGFGRF
jgi:hypothetical protein